MTEEGNMMYKIYNYRGLILLCVQYVSSTRSITNPQEYTHAICLEFLDKYSRNATRV
jgi:hypothetical protein